MYKLVLSFPQDYPFSPPKCKFPVAQAIFCCNCTTVTSWKPDLFLDLSGNVEVHIYVNNQLFPSKFLSPIVHPTCLFNMMSWLTAVAPCSVSDVSTPISLTKFNEDDCLICIRCVQSCYLTSKCFSFWQSLLVADRQE